MATRSLGTLTLDLVAKTGGYVAGMTKAERESEKWRKKVKSQVEDVAKTFATVGAAAGIGLAALTAKTVQSANEIERLSRVSNTSAESFQRYSAGARAFGIEQEKLADIFKDTSDKVGDFLQTGGGPLADFFENIAPQVGVTAEQFRQLSGPQALELYVSSLEKANVSQSDMTFYLEAIASDATLLFPLLKNGAEGFRAFGDEAERAGAIMGKDTLQAANELSAAMFLAEQGAAGIKNQIAQGLLPVLSDLAGEFSDASSQGDIFVETGESVGMAMKGITAAGVGAVASIQLIGKALGAFAAAVSESGIEWEDLVRPFGLFQAAGKVGDNFDKVKNVMAVGVEDIEATAMRYADILNGIFEAGTEGGGGNDNRVKQLAERLANDRAAIAAALSGTGSTFQGREASDDAQGEIDRINEQAEAIRASLLTEEEAIEESYLRRRELVLKNTEITGDAQRKLLERLEADREQALSETSAQREMDRINQQAEAIAAGLMSEEEKIQESYQRRREIILANTAIIGEERNQLLLELENQVQEQLLESNGSFWEQWLEAAETNLMDFDELSQNVIENSIGKMGDAFESLIFDGTSFGDSMREMFESLARTVVNALGQMGAQWLAYKLVQSTVQKSAQTAAVAQVTANTQAQSLSAGINAFASTAAIPIVGPVMAPAAMSAALAITQPMAAAAAAAASAGLASFEGGGFTGNGPRVGGLDGKGGYMAMVHPNEKVVDLTKQRQGGGENQPIRIINLNSDDQIEDYLGSDRAERVIMNVVRRNGLS